MCWLALQFLWFPCGIIRGGLASLGIDAIVQAETSELPAATFQIKTAVTKSWLFAFIFRYGPTRNTLNDRLRFHRVKDRSISTGHQLQVHLLVADPLLPPLHACLLWCQFYSLNAPHCKLDVSCSIDCGRVTYSLREKPHVLVSAYAGSKLTILLSRKTETKDTW